MDTILARVFKKFIVTRKDLLVTQRYFENPIPNDLNPIQKEAWETYIHKTIISILASIENNFEDSEINAPNGIYLGTAGVSYLYYNLSKNPLYSNKHEDFIRKAQEYIKPAINYFLQNAYKPKNKPSFLLGSCGIFAMSACVYEATGIHWLAEKYYKLYIHAGYNCMKVNFLKYGSDDFFVGRAGYILGYLFLCKELKKQPSLSHLYKICDVMIESGRRYSLKKNSDCPLLYAYYKKDYVGASHGIASILLALLSVPEYLQQHPNYFGFIKNSVDFILELQDQEGNFPVLMSENNEDKNSLTQWCHGSGGVVYLLAKAYLIWKEDKYLKSLELAAENIWCCGLLTKGPGLCHGISGNGYVFLLMYRLTKEQKYLDRAFAFAKFMESAVFRDTAKIPDHPYSLFEGVAGTALFLNDLLQPELASFPFMDVFSSFTIPD